MREMSSIITESGDIQLHGREGVVASLLFEDEDGSPRNMASATVRFETPTFTKDLTLGSEPNQMVLTLDRGELPNTIGKVSEFVVTDHSGSVPHVVWGGKLILLGWV